MRFPKESTRSNRGGSYPSAALGGGDYRVDRPGGGRTLEADPVTSEAVRYMGKLLLEGQSRWMIAAALEAAGVDTPASHVWKNQGETYSSKCKTAPRNHWNASSGGKILRSPATMGFTLVGRSVKARKLARDAKGLPIRIAKPLFTDEEWAAIQAAVDERSVTRERATPATAAYTSTTGA